MDETSTSTLNSTNNPTVKTLNLTEGLNAEEFIFFNSVRTDLDMLKKKPSERVISNILNYSKKLRS